MDLFGIQVYISLALAVLLPAWLWIPPVAAVDEQQLHLPEDAADTQPHGASLSLMAELKLCATRFELYIFGVTVG